MTKPPLHDHLYAELHGNLQEARCDFKLRINFTYMQAAPQNPLHQYSWQGNALFNTFDIPRLTPDKSMPLSSEQD